MSLSHFKMDDFHACFSSEFMSSLHSWKHVFIIGTGITVAYLTIQAVDAYKKKQRRKKWSTVGKDVVVLHQIGRGRWTPNISPFPLKLETYLRMAGITYEIDIEEPMGPKGKTPWITINGEEIPDSQICLELLARKFHKDFSSHLTPGEQATARAFQIMMEEHYYWVIVAYRWVYRKGHDLAQIMPSMPWFVIKFLRPLISHQMKKAAWSQGLGRHTEAEATEMGMKDLRAVSMYLGTKPFLMGDKPTEVDCAVFGILSQSLWNLPGSPFEQVLNGEFVNLKEYCHRMKETFWPDWDRCLDPCNA